MQGKGKEMDDLVIEQEALDLAHVTTETAIVHTLPYPGPFCDPVPSYRIVPTGTLSMKDLPSDEITVVTGTMAVQGQVLEASRRRLVEAISSMRAAADAEGGDGFLLGYDPLGPSARIASTELGISDDCLFVWNRGRGEGPLFQWDEVAHLTTTEDTMRAFLVDGRVVTLYADIDWWNRLD